MNGHRLIANVVAATLRAQFAQTFKAEAPYNLLFPKGQWHGANLAPIGGSIDLDSGILEEMVANWEAAGRPPLPIRKTHRHLDEDVPAKDRLELERAYGFLTDLRVTAAGLEAKTEWNAAGKAEVDSGAWAFWSPEWQPKHRDRRTGDVKGWWLSGTALTNDPFFNEMPPVAAAALPAAPQGNTMTEEQLKLRALLGLAPTATDAEVLTAQTKQAAELATLKASTTKPGLTKADLDAAIAAHVEPLKASLKASDEARVALETEATGLKVDALIASAKAGDGKNGRAIVDEKVRPVLLKLVASEAKQEDGFKAAKEYLDGIPLTVPVTAAGVPGTAAPLTASSANAKIAARADELRKAGDLTPTLTAMREMPTETLIAENRRPTSQN